MINHQWLKQPISQTNSHGPKVVQAIEVQLYMNAQTITIFVVHLMFVILVISINTFDNMCRKW